MGKFMLCPVCSSTSFSDYFGRKDALCSGCGSIERTRVAKLLIDHVVKLQPGARVLHLHPEPGLMAVLRASVGAGYDAVEPKGRRAAEGVRSIDPWQALDAIEPNSLELVLHNHMIQEIEGNYTVFLQRLHAKLRPGGYHLFSVPLSPGFFREDANPKMAQEERKAQLGRERHMRRFGRSDFHTTLGAVFDIPKNYSLLDLLLPEVLLAANVPDTQWKQSNAMVFCVRR
jgi:hypothetical protein